MTADNPLPHDAPGHLPTLTEVVDWPLRTAGSGPAKSSEPGSERQATPESVTVFKPESVPESGPAPGPVHGASPALPSEEWLTERVLVDLQRQLDLLLEYRMRELLTPLLNRAADGLVRDARGALASTLRDLVSGIVAQELARHRDR